MPFVRISLLKGKANDHIRAIADGVHQALTEAFEVPADDRFQVIDEYEPEKFIYNANYFGIHRSNDVVFINILASNWRTTSAKQRLYRRIAELLSANPGLRPEDVQINLTPNQREDWSFGNGLASYVKDAREPQTVETGSAGVASL